MEVVYRQEHMIYDIELFHGGFDDGADERFGRATVELDNDYYYRWIAIGKISDAGTKICDHMLCKPVVDCEGNGGGR